MNAGRTAREHARAELVSAIKDEARGQLARTGAQGLSLRAVAREIGMVSSALYRYFPNRDALLTALIVDAYDTLGERTERAVDSRLRPPARWHAGCAAIREWARDNPHEYALIYGSPVPGYQAPQETTASASRASIALLNTVRSAHAAGALRTTSSPVEGPTGLAGQQLATSIAPDLPEEVLTRTLIAWTQLFGMVSFELFGHLAGSVSPESDFFENAVWHMAWFVGFDVHGNRGEQATDDR